MRFYSGKIRSKANVNVGNILEQLERSRNNFSNPFEDVEDDHDKAFSSAAPHRVERIHGTNGSVPHFHFDETGNKTGVAKPGAQDAMRESLAYQLSKHYAPGIIPRTVVRNYPSPMQYGFGQPILHSVQQYVQPARSGHDQMTDPDIVNHPDYHKIAIMDWLHGNTDRHYHNMITDEHGRLHAIDNGMSFMQPNLNRVTHDKEGNALDHNTQELTHYNLSNIAYNGSFPEIPPDMRQAILKADPQKLGGLFDKVLNHGLHINESAKNEYLRRLQTLKNHFANPYVKDMHDLHEKLYSDMHPGASDSLDPAARFELEMESPQSNYHSSF